MFLLFVISFNSNAELIDISQMENNEIAKILREIDVEVSVSEQDVNSSKNEVIFHISKHASLWTGWETHAVCKLKKSGTSYKCRMENVKMSHVISSLTSKYYRISVSEPYEHSFCSDVRFDKSSLKIDKSGGLFSKKYTLIIEMDNCTFH